MEARKAADGMDNTIPLRKHYGVSSKRSRRTALRVTAEKCYPGMRFTLRHARRMKDNLGIELLFGFRLVSGRMNRASARRAARALFGDSRKSFLIARLLTRPVHPAHAVMLAFSAAAGGKIRLRIRGDERRNQRPTEEHHQRDGDGAAHNFADSIASCELGEIIPSMYGLDTQCAGLAAAPGRR